MVYNKFMLDLSVKTIQKFEGVSISNNRKFRIGFQQRGQSAGMIGFGMINDKVIQGLFVKNIPDLRNKGIRIGQFNRIDQNGLFIIDQICIICNALR